MALLLPFFRGGRVLPVLRGGGPHHHFIDDTVRKLEAGDWVHVFPTGRRDPDSRTLGQLRPGVGRMIASCEPPPVVEPVVPVDEERERRDRDDAERRRPRAERERRVGRERHDDREQRARHRPEPILELRRARARGAAREGVASAR